MPEPTSYAFRTVVGGFHKGDVSAYIAKTAAEHQAQIAALQNQLESLQLENEQLRQRKPQPLPFGIRNLPPIGGQKLLNG